jgi:F0F1-type ATP synthase membrane subunit c/vacuolar-type H+-ATPase subunit K
MIDVVTTLLNLAAGIGVLAAVCAGGLLFAELVDAVAEHSPWFADNRENLFWIIVVFVVLWSAQSIGADAIAWAAENL